MKKRDWFFIGIVFVIAALMFLGMKIFSNTNKGEQLIGTVYLEGEVLFEFDISEDKTYSFEGSYGHMELEVKDGKWHIINETCPNHNCSNLGWVSLDSLFPIVCVPNNVSVSGSSRSSVKGEYSKYSRSTASTFSTKMTLQAYTLTKEEFDSFYSIFEGYVYHYNQLFDKYNSYEGINNVKTINDQAGIAPVKVDPVLIELLLTSREWYEKTDGYVDISMGAVLEIWHDYREEGEELNSFNEYGRVPEKSLLEATKVFTGWDYVLIDEENSTVFITNENASLDVGSVAKGFAVEKIGAILLENGLKYGLINGGGNIKLLGNKPDGTRWNVGINEPIKKLFEDTENSLDAFRLEMMTSAVTSGDYERYYYALNDSDEEVKLHHLINPYTLMPFDHVRSVTIFVENSTYGDLLSSYFSLASFEEGLMKFNELTDEGFDLGVVWVFDEDQGEIEGTIRLKTTGYKQDIYYLYMTNNLRERSLTLNP